MPANVERIVDVDQLSGRLVRDVVGATERPGSSGEALPVCLRRGTELLQKAVGCARNKGGRTRP